MLTKSIFYIPGKQKGLVSCPDPFGSKYLGTTQLMLNMVRGVVQSGVVEFYMSLEGDVLREDYSIALGFSEIKTIKELKKIKYEYENQKLMVDWDNNIETYYETNCEEDREMAREAEKNRDRELALGAEKLDLDYWTIEPLSEIRKKFKHIGTLEYKDGSVISIVFIDDKSPFEEILNNWEETRLLMEERKIYG